MTLDHPRRAGRLSGNTLSLVLPGGPEAAGEARSGLGLLAREFDAGVLDRLRLLVSELITNSVRHGGAGPDDPIRVEIVASDGGVRGEVIDLGPGFDVPQPVPTPDGQGGLGLLIVERIAARWGTEEGGRRVWFEIEPEREQALREQARA